MRPQCCLFWLRFSKSLGPEPHQLTNILVILEIFMIYLQSIQSSDTRQTKLKQKKICFYTMPSASQTKGGEKHHRCPMCNYSFNSAALLKIHILVHTGEKPFSCNQCEYKCTQGGNLKIHMLIHAQCHRFVLLDGLCNTLSMLGLWDNIYAQVPPSALTLSQLHWFSCLL